MPMHVAQLILGPARSRGDLSKAAPLQMRALFAIRRFGFLRRR